MLNPIRQDQLRSFDEVLDSNLKIFSGNGLDEIYRTNPKYQKAKQDLRVLDLPYYKNWPAKVIEMNLAHTQPCKIMKNRIENWGDGKSWEGLYLIPEKFMTTPEDLYVRPYHRFLGEFQKFMDLFFEAGLPKLWEQEFFKNFNQGIKRIEKDKEKKFLDFEAIGPFFLILIVGFAAAFFTLLFEIFCHDFVSQLSKEFLNRKFEKFLRKKRKGAKVRVRKVQVKPAARNHCVVINPRVKKISVLKS